MSVCFGFSLMQNPHHKAFLWDFQFMAPNLYLLLSWMIFQKQVVCVQSIEIIQDPDSHFLRVWPSFSGWNGAV